MHARGQPRAGGDRRPCTGPAWSTAPSRLFGGGRHLVTVFPH